MLLCLSYSSWQLSLWSGVGNRKPSSLFLSKQGFNTFWRTIDWPTGIHIRYVHKDLLKLYFFMKYLFSLTIVSFMVLFGCLSNSVGGKLADVVGRRKMFVLNGVFLLPCWFGLIYPPSFAVLLVVKAVMGMCAAFSYSLTVVYLSEMSTIVWRGMLCHVQMQYSSSSWCSILWSDIVINCESHPQVNQVYSEILI